MQDIKITKERMDQIKGEQHPIDLTNKLKVFQSRKEFEEIPKEEKIEILEIKETNDTDILKHILYLHSNVPYGTHKEILEKQSIFNQYLESIKIIKKWN